ILSVIWFGGGLVASGAMEAPLLVSFVGFCFSLNFAMQGVNFSLDDVKRGHTALQRIFEVMEPVGQPPRHTGLDVIQPKEFEGRVDFKRVHFWYPTRPDTPVFEGLELSLPAGKVTALVRRGEERRGG
ncbi:unnamed protein product, partial [Discosporangium mesarthrocarpum]